MRTESSATTASAVVARLLGFALLSASIACWGQQAGTLRLRRAEEIAPFRLIGIDGYVAARFLSDETRTSGQTGGAGSRQSTSTLGEELFVMTHSYVYHPTLLTLDIGGGPLIERTGVEADGAATRSGRQLYNLTARATVLREKPYTGALFYDHRSQTQNVGPAQTMLTENTRYGIDFALLRPVTPLPLRLDASRSSSQGSGAGQILDDQTDRINLRLDWNIGAMGQSVFQYLGTRQESVSGSSGLPIFSSTSARDNFNLDTRLRFGAKGEYDLANVITLNTQQQSGGPTPIAGLQETRFGLDLRGYHSPELQTFGRYNLSTSRQGEQAINLNALGGGATYRLSPELLGTVSARAETNRTTQFTSSLRGIDGSAQYRRALALGEGSARYGFAYTQREQQASAAQARVLGERFALLGLSIVTLASPLVVAGSVTVSNLTRTQIFVEGIDYSLSVVGNRTRIQRLVGGNILDGQEVLVDYSTEVGGSYGLNQLDQSVNFGWGLKSYLNAYLTFANSSPRLTSGRPAFTLNEVQSVLLGARAEVPLELLPDLLPELRIGGNAERENRRETISPYHRASYEAHTIIGLPWVRRGDLRLGTRRLQIDYELNPLVGVKLVAYDLRLWGRLPYGVDVSLDASRERDTGTPVARERSILLARARWRLRRFQLSFELNRTRDVQGAIERSRTFVLLWIRRDF